MDYTSASESLTGRCKNRRKIANNTYLERRAEGAIAVRLHATDIVTYKPDGSVVLDSGGWRTVTTKARMNEYLSRSGVNIWQERGQWIVSVRTTSVAHGADANRCLFEDEMTIQADGTVTGGSPLADLKAALKLRTRVQRFAAGYIKALKAGKVSAPSAGDCFYCGMREVDTHKPLGECTKNADHILSHIAERYYVPSLLLRTLEVMPASIAMKQTVAALWQGKPELAFQGDFIYSQLQKQLGRYCLRQLGQAA